MNDADPYTFAEYERAASRTIRIDSGRELLINGALGVTGEAGEIADIVKKHLHHGATLDSARIIEEIGDCLWYLNEIALTVGASLTIAAQYNVDKLAARHAGGAFDAERQRAKADETTSPAERLARVMRQRRPPFDTFDAADHSRYDHE